MGEAKKAAVEQEEGAADGKKIGVSGPQVAGGALASVTAAFLGGQLGVAGTLWGAGLTSVVITVGGAVYQHSLERSREKANLAAAKAGLKLPAKRPRPGGSEADPRSGGSTERSRADQQGLTGSLPARHPERSTTRHAPAPPANHAGPPQAVGRSDPASTRRIRPAASSGMHWPGGESVLEQHPGPPPEAETRVLGRSESTGRTQLVRAGAATASRRRIRWGVVAVTSAMIFGLGMLVVTGFEGIAGKPVSGGQAGTTVGQLFTRSAEHSELPAKPETIPSGQPERSGRHPSVEPSSEPSAESNPEQSAEQNPGSDSAPRERGAVPQPAETSRSAPESPASTPEPSVEEATPDSAVSPQNGINGENSATSEQ